MRRENSEREAGKKRRRCCGDLVWVMFLLEGKWYRVCGPASYSLHPFDGTSPYPSNVERYADSANHE
ncbi:hypothetical protein ANTPLA_LOCUS5443 [Anthophora plagiata]